MSLPNPEILYFGCIGKVGHNLHSKQQHIQFHETPWGYKLDEEIPAVEYEPEGLLRTFHKDGWTAVAFYDRSVDDRPGSKSIFLVAKDWPTEKVMAAAERQWPEVCGRPRFPIKPAVVDEWE